MTEKMKIVLGGWKRGMKLVCRACGKGKFTADHPDPACPKCGQVHEVKVQM